MKEAWGIIIHYSGLFGLFIIGYLGFILWRGYKIAQTMLNRQDTIHQRLIEVERIYRYHSYAKCPQCNRVAIAGAGCEGVRFICPHCESKSTWEMVNIKGRIVYLLIPDTPRPTPETPVKSPLLREIEILRNAKRR